MPGTNERRRKWLAGGIALFLTALLLPLLARYHRTGWLQAKPGTAHASHPRVAAHVKPAFALTDRFGDGTPDFLRLSDPADQAAFRRWFTSIAEFQAVRPRGEVPAEINDCASLLRYAYREALKRHDDPWFVATGMEVAALVGEIRAWRYPETPLGAALFRVAPGSFAAEDLRDGAFAQFADARTLLERNAFRIGRDVGLARPGDLLFFRQFGQSSPWHSMIVVSPGAQGRVVYHTGPDHGQPGELRRVPLAELLDHPQAQWRPLAANPNFLGVYRWTILRGNS